MVIGASRIDGRGSIDMFGLGIGELLVILVIVLIIFGAGKLPEIGEGLGRGIRSFRKAVKAPDEIDVTPKPSGDDSAASRRDEAAKPPEGGNPQA
jgi:sec-independent protein translocase protein TatA